MIITDYLTFQLFTDGLLAASISIGHIQDGKIKSVSGNYPVLTETVSEFCSYGRQTIKSAARLHYPTPETFNRQEAANLIPKSNSFLRKLFQYIAGYDLDDRIKWIVDVLAGIFRAANVKELLKDFGKATQQQ